MPLSNLFKNCAYYWAFGAVIGHPLAHPNFTPPEEWQVYLGLGGWGEIDLDTAKIQNIIVKLSPQGFLFSRKLEISLSTSCLAT